MRLGALLSKAICKGFALVLCVCPGNHQRLLAGTGQDKILRRSTGVLVGSAVKRVEPEYPADARRKGIHGKVVVQVTIDDKGQVVSAKPMTGPDELREAAVRAARRWKFTPTSLSGVAVQVVGEISFNFEFDGDVVASSDGASQARGRTVSANSPILLLSEQERRGLNKRLGAAAPVQLNIGEQGGAWLGIAGATIRWSKLGPGPDTRDGVDPYHRDRYVMKADVDLFNRTDQRVVSAGLQFMSPQTNEVFYVYPTGLSIGRGKRGRFEIPLMLLNVDPSQLSVRAVGALFGDSSIWGAFPFPPPLRGDPKPVQQAGVDSKPELISPIHPNYTDEARRNRVRGSVRLGLEIGPDGAVKRLEILNALPDGLTDEAIRIARRLNFKPAMRSGGPVPCQMNLDIEFKGG